eukprot:PITA_12896
MGWHIHQMDVKIVFLNRVIEEEVCIEQPEGFEIFSSESHVCRLKRVLYGLKQAPRAWYTWIDSYFTRLGFSKSEADPNLYQIVVEGFEVFSSESHVCRLKRALYGLKQAPHAWYTRIDNYFTGLGFSKSEADPKLYQIVVEGKLLIIVLLGREPTDRKSTSGGIFNIGSTVVSWYNRKHRSVALSSIEAKYMAASLAACEAIWMRKILVGLFGSHLDPTVIYCDNQSCIKLSANPVFHDRSKHIDIRYHHIRDCVQRRIMLLSYIPTEDHDADILTKVLTKRKFEYHRGRIGVADNPYLVEREC